MDIDHQCWWTRRHLTELSERESRLYGVGVPIEALTMAAAELGAALSRRPSATDEYGDDIVLGDVATGGTHDGCFFGLEPVSHDLKRGLLDAVLALHAHYLGREMDWSRIRAELLDLWEPEIAIRMRSFPAPADNCVSVCR